MAWSDEWLRTRNGQGIREGTTHRCASVEMTEPHPMIHRWRGMVVSVCALALGLGAGGLVATGWAEEVMVKDGAGLRAAVAAATPGTTIRLAGGEYAGGFHFRGLAGAAGRPLILVAADAKDPPRFVGAETGLHLASPVHVELRGLVFDGLTANGVNIDDTGGRKAQHLVLRGVRFTGIGSKGNQDALKLSGVYDFTVAECAFDRWGSGGGSGIDMVGCHRGIIENCSFGGTEGLQSNGVQAKGGSTEIAIRRSRFAQTGGRGVNLGGSTGEPFFRPPLAEGGGNAEARDLRVEGNVFSGTSAPVVFAGVDGALVRFNTLENPGRWAVRLLQENAGPAFVPCRNGVFSDNRIVFQSGSWSEGGVNIGGGTDPTSFTFARNWWHCSDRPDRSRPRLPVEETDGHYGRGADAGHEVAGAEAWKPDR